MMIKPLSVAFYMTAGGCGSRPGRHTGWSEK